MDSSGELFLRSREVNVVFISRVSKQINTKITAEWAKKQFVTCAHTLFYFLHDIIKYDKQTIFMHRLRVSIALFTFSTNDCRAHCDCHYSDVIKIVMAPQSTSVSIVYLTGCSCADEWKVKAPRHWPLCREFTGDRRIPRTKGQKRGKCSHLMTSSCETGTWKMASNSSDIFLCTVIFTASRVTKIISSHTLLNMWLHIHAGLKSIQFSKRGPSSDNNL